MKVYSNRAREQAALILQIAASNELGALDVPSRIDAHVSIGAIDLACHARRFVMFNSKHHIGSPEIRAEAEALIREGWTP